VAKKVVKVAQNFQFTVASHSKMLVLAGKGTKLGNWGSEATPTIPESHATPTMIFVAMPNVSILPGQTFSVYETKQLLEVKLVEILAAKTASSAMFVFMCFNMYQQIAVHHYLLSKGWHCPNKTFLFSNLVVATKNAALYAANQERAHEDRASADDQAWVAFFEKKGGFGEHSAVYEEKMVFLFALHYFTIVGDVVWQLNATDMPIFSECAIACHRNPLVVFAEAQEEAALTRLQAADAFTYAKPVNVAKRRHLMLTTQLYEESSKPKHAAVPVWNSYSDPERVFTILALVSSTQNATTYQEVGSFLGDYATSTWFLDSQTPIISKPVEDEEVLSSQFEIKESKLLDSTGHGAGRGAFATGSHVRHADIFTPMQGRWIPKYFPFADEDGVKKPYQWNVDESFEVYFVSSSIYGGDQCDQFFNVAIDPEAEDFYKGSTKAQANVSIRRKDSDKGSLNLQASCIVAVKEGDELLLSYNTAPSKPPVGKTSSKTGKNAKKRKL
jgi:hypothetical protein